MKNNLYRLKNYVNKNTSNIDETFLIVFNNYFNTNFLVPDTFFENTFYESPSWIIIYTIITYQNSDFVTKHYLFIDALCTNIITHKISYFHLKRITKFFLDESIQNIINKALKKKAISPSYIMNSILNSFSSDILQPNKNKIIKIITNYVDNFNYQLFNNNYDFFNIYNNLKELWNNYLIFDLPNINLNILDNLLKFEEHPAKERIKQDFSNIEKKDTDISSKFLDCLTIINRYSYDS